jgi:membrane protein required for colicin V production
MLVDVIAVILLGLAIFKGYRRGLIVGIFSFIAILIGLAAAIKLSLVVAEHLGKSVSLSGRWLPLLSFLLVFIVVILLVRLGANLIQRTVETAMLGWANRLGGIVLYLAIYIAVFSVVLFYADQMQLIKPEAIRSSVTYSFIRPLGPKSVDLFGLAIPIFQNMFIGLENFFEGISTQI